MAEKRDFLLRYDAERRYHHNKEMETAIENALKSSELTEYLKTDPDVIASEESEKVYQNNICQLKCLLREILDEAQKSRIKLSKLSLQGTLKGSELPESQEYYKKLIDNTYGNHAQQFRIICENGFNEFKPLVEMAKSDRKNCVDKSGAANIAINFVYILLGPVTRTLEHLENMKELLANLSGLVAQQDNNSHDKIEVVLSDLRELVKEWNEEQTIVDRKRFDLLDALRGSISTVALLEQSITSSIEEYLRACDQCQTRVIQHRILTLSTVNLANLKTIIDGVEGFQERLLTVSEIMTTINMEYVPGTPDLPVFI